MPWKCLTVTPRFSYHLCRIWFLRLIDANVHVDVLEEMPPGLTERQKIQWLLRATEERPRMKGSCNAVVTSNARRPGYHEAHHMLVIRMLHLQ